ncbi:MAG: capsular biosynthesis protein [Tenericutes bacterium HGW-Tenericutes-6]|jgi:capsular exopolysaccharide synthesis family protein|nr:MAG: capsular biosynthesis protein [Tenericutes bacterium HGW-Tenericutes-6]
MGKKKLNIFNGERNERYDYIVTKEQPLSYTAESFQKVLINLDYANIDHEYKVIQFTSTLASEGKSTFVSNMAYLLGQKEKKVVLIDLDLRKPKMHRVFNVANKDGLTDFLAGKVTYQQLIKKSDDFGVDFINTGEKTTAVVNILESNKLKELIDKLKEDYDFILLDAPPVLAVSDALYISKFSDAVIFVVAQGVAKKALVKEAIQTLKHNHVNIIGTVLTQVNIKSQGYDYTYGYGE